jgi:hypothetical protein
MYLSKIRAKVKDSPSQLNPTLNKNALPDYPTACDKYWRFKREWPKTRTKNDLLEASAIQFSRESKN